MALRSIIFMRGAGNLKQNPTVDLSDWLAAAIDVAVLACDALFLGACLGHFEGSKVSTRNACYLLSKEFALTS